MKKVTDDVSQRRQRKLVLDSLVLGVVGAISAQVFTLLLDLSRSFFLTGIAGYQAPGLPGEGVDVTNQSEVLEAYKEAVEVFLGIFDPRLRMLGEFFQ